MENTANKVITCFNMVNSTICRNIGEHTSLVDTMVANTAANIVDRIVERIVDRIVDRTADLTVDRMAVANGNAGDHGQLTRTTASPTRPRAVRKVKKVVATKVGATAEVTATKVENIMEITQAIMLAFLCGIALKTKMVANACAAAATISPMWPLVCAKKLSSETK